MNKGHIRVEAGGFTHGIPSPTIHIPCKASAEKMKKHSSSIAGRAEYYKDG